MYPIFFYLAMSWVMAQDATFTPLHFDYFKVVKEYNLSVTDSPEVRADTSSWIYLREIEGKWFLGVGAKAVDSSVAHFTQFVQVGGYPSLSHYYRINCYRKSLTAIRSTCFNQVPQSLEEFDLLQEGDWYYYQGYLGLVVLAGWGNSSPLVAVGPKISIEGGWQVYVEKKSNHKVYLEIRPTKVTNVGLLAGFSWVVGAEKAIMSQLSDNGLVFILDRYQHEHLLEGFLTRRDVSEIQKQVTPSGSVHQRRIRQASQFFFATPIFPFLFLGTSVSKETSQSVYKYEWEENPRYLELYQRRKDNVSRVVSLYNTSSRTVRYDNENHKITISQEFFHNKAGSFIINSHYDDNKDLFETYFPSLKFDRRIPKGTFEMIFSIQVPVQTANPQKEVDAYFKLWKNSGNERELIGDLQALDTPVIITLDVKGTYFPRRIYKRILQGSEIPLPPSPKLPDNL